MSREDLTPFERMLYDDPVYSTQSGPKSATCYICRDPDFAMMGLPLCTACPICGAHVAADDIECDNGHDVMEHYYMMSTHLDNRIRLAPHGDPWK